MSRVKFKQNQQRYFFKIVKEITGLNWTKMAILCKVHPRSVSDWAREKQLPTESSIKILCELSKLSFPESELVHEYWYTSKAGKIGGKNNVLRNGNPGTPEGRRSGGSRSVEINRKLSNRFIKRKLVNIPNQSRELAELFGILLGDGHLRKGRFGITLSKLVDKEYSVYVSNLVKSLFGINPHVFVRANYIQIDFISIEVSEFLVRNGLKTGSKVKNQVDVPLWIKNSEIYSQACLRGMVDTDGSVYFDKHKIKGKHYSSICIDFTNHSNPLLNFVKEFLFLNNYSITRSLWNVRLRRRNDVQRYFNEIGFSNIKHKIKVTKFFKIGEVV